MSAFHVLPVRCRPLLVGLALSLTTMVPPGGYYVDEVGDFGPLDEAPVMNIYSGGPALGTGSGAPPQLPAATPAPAQDPPPAVTAPATPDTTPPVTDAAAALVGARIFWVYSPSIFYSATGGASGYIHLCPGSVFHRSSESSFSVGGDYDSEHGMNDSWAGGAHVARSSGRWSLQGAGAGVALLLQNADGSTQRFAADALRQGRWQIGQTRYAVESGRASCP